MRPHTTPRIRIHKELDAWWVTVPGDHVTIGVPTFEQAIALAEYTIWDRPRIEAQEPCS